jgi:hypothetical protein
MTRQEDVRGLDGRVWTMPFLCAASSAPVSAIAMSTNVAGSSGSALETLPKRLALEELHDE